jgi:hypothetical protein
MSDEKFKLLVSNLPSVTALLAVTLSMLTIFVNYFISKRQSRTQLTITIEKDWIEKIRNLVVDVLVDADYIFYAERHQVLNSDVYQEKLKGLTKVGGLLSVYLNFSHPLENDLFTAISEITLPIFHHQTVTTEVYGVRRKRILTCTQKLIESKHKLY